MTTTTTHGFDFATFSLKLEAATRIAFEELATAHPEEKLCAFALYSDGCAETVCASTNTLAHLEKRTAQFPRDIDYYKFAPAEWSLENKGADTQFGALCNELYTHVSGRDLLMHPDAHEAFQRDLAETCISVLERLRAERFFERVAKGPVVLVFQASVGDAEVDVERRMMARLNEPDVVQQHFRWSETWARRS